MKRNTWLSALCALALAGPAMAQSGSQGTGSSGSDSFGTSQGSTTSDDYGKQGDVKGSQGSVGSQGSTGSQGSMNQGSQGSMNQGSQGSMGSTGSAQQGKNGSFASNQVVGQIKEVDSSSKEIKIDQAGKEQDLKLGDNATVFLEGRLGSIDDLKEGQQVRAAYEEKGGAKTLRWIEVNPAGGGGMQQKNPSDSGATTPKSPSNSGSTTQPAPAPAPKSNDMGGGGDADTYQGSSGSSDTNVPDDSSFGHESDSQGNLGSSGSDTSGNIGAQPGTTGTTGGLQQQGSADMKNQITGRVVSVDSNKNQLVLDQAGKQWTLEVKDDAQVFIEGKKSSLNAIKEGQQVRASLDPAKSQKTAIRIESVDNAKMQQPQGVSPTPEKGTTGGMHHDSGSKTY